MQITHCDNPLATKIELSPQEKDILWHKLRYQLLAKCVRAAYFYLTDDIHYNVEKARDAIEPVFYLPSGEGGAPIDTSATALLAEYLTALTLPHYGDCIGAPTPCQKCEAESYIGADTLEGLSQPVAYVIKQAFQNGKDITSAVAFIHEKINSQAGISTNEIEDFRSALNWLLERQNYSSAPTNRIRAQIVPVEKLASHNNTEQSLFYDRLSYLVWKKDWSMKHIAYCRLITWLKKCKANQQRTKGVSYIDAEIKKAGEILKNHYLLLIKAKQRAGELMKKDA